MPLILSLREIEMNELVSKTARPTDVSFVEKTGDRTNVYEVTKQSPIGGVLRNHVNAVANLDARDRPGYRNRHHRPEVFKSHDYAEPMSILRKERRIKKINAISVLLLILVVSMAILMVVNSTKITGILFGVSLFGFILNQLLHKEVAVEPKVVSH